MEVTSKIKKFKMDRDFFDSLETLQTILEEHWKLSGFILEDQSECFTFINE